MLMENMSLIALEVDISQFHFLVCFSTVNLAYMDVFVVLLKPACFSRLFADN